MAAVDPIPTYKHQTLKVLIRSLCMAGAEQTAKDLLTKFDNYGTPQWEVCAEEIADMAWFGPVGGYVETDPAYWAEGIDEWENVVMSTRKSNMPDFEVAQGIGTSRWVEAMLARHPDYRWQSDETGRCTAMLAILNNEWAVQPSTVAANTAKSCSKILFQTSLPDMKLTAKNAISAWDSIDSVFDCCAEEVATAEFVEAWHLASPPQAAAIKEFLATGEGDPLEVFLAAPRSKVHCAKSVTVYRVLGLWIIADHKRKVILVFDRPSMEQIRVRSRRNCNWKYAVINFRRTNGGRDRDAFCQPLMQEVRGFLIDALNVLSRGTRSPHLLAKAMKTILAAAISSHDVGPEPQALRDQNVDKARVMVNEAEDAWPGIRALWDTISRYPVHIDILADQIYMFHFVPSSDCDPFTLFTKTVETMRSANKADPAAKDEFLAYAKSWLMVYTITADPSKAKFVQSVPGHAYGKTRWFQQCLEGRAAMPPREDLGKAWLVGGYHYKEVLPYWWLGAADVTHVSSLYEEWPPKAHEGRVARSEANELLYVLQHGSILSGRYTPEEVRAHVLAKDKPYRTCSELSCKAENTKGEEKMREIHSACDTWREVQSELDSNTVTISSNVPGPALRMSANKVSKSMHRIAEGITGTGRVVCTSQDVSSWSPKMDRELLFDFHDVIRQAYTDTTRIPRLRDVWEGCELRINKGGAIRSACVQTGAIMGFTGGIDTLMHSALLAFLIHKLKDQGLLEQTEAAEVMAQIDDAVASIELSRPTSECQGRIDDIGTALVQIYRSLGFEIDVVKTITSATRMTFLNRVYIEGIEALTSTKVFAKTAKESTLMFSSILTQIDAIATGTFCASDRGMDPYAAYRYYLEYSMYEIIKTVPATTSHAHTRIAFVARVPRDLGGWGLKSLIEWVGSGRGDHISSWGAEVAAFDAATAQADRMAGKDDYKMCVQATINQPMYAGATPALRTCSSPTMVRLSDVPDPEGIKVRALLRGAIRFARDPTILAYLTQTESPEVEKALDELLSAGTMSAALASAIYAALPAQLLAGMVARVERSDAIAQLLPLRVRKKVRADMRAADHRKIMHLLNTINKYTGGPRPIPFSSGVQFATRLRTDFFAFLGYTITGATVPAATEILGHTDKPSASLVLVNHGVRPPGIRKEGDYYWGRSAGPQSHGISSKALVWKNWPSYRETAPGIRDIIRALAIAQLELGAAGSMPVVMLLGKLWCNDQEAFVGIPLPSPVTTSVKRLLRDTLYPNQAIAAFPNVQGSVQVHDEGVTAFLFRNKNMHNPLALIQEIRALGLFDAAAGVNWDKRYYGLLGHGYSGRDDKPGDLPPTDGLMAAIGCIQGPETSQMDMVKSVLAVIEALEPVEDDEPLWPEDAPETKERALPVRPTYTRAMMPAVDAELAEMHGARSDVIVGPLPTAEYVASAPALSRGTDILKAATMERRRGVHSQFEELRRGVTSSINSALTIIHNRVAEQFRAFTIEGELEGLTPQEVIDMEVSTRGEDAVVLAGHCLRADYRRFIQDKYDDVFRAWLDRDVVSEPLGISANSIITGLQAKGTRSPALDHLMGIIVLRAHGIVKYRSDYQLDLRHKPIGRLLDDWFCAIRERKKTRGPNHILEILRLAQASNSGATTVSALIHAVCQAIREYISAKGYPRHAIIDWARTKKNAATSAYTKEMSSRGDAVLLNAVHFLRDRCFTLKAVSCYNPGAAAPAILHYTPEHRQTAPTSGGFNLDSLMASLEDDTKSADLLPADMLDEPGCTVREAYNLACSTCFVTPREISETEMREEARQLGWDLDKIIADPDQSREARATYAARGQQRNRDVFKH